MFNYIVSSGLESLIQRYINNNAFSLMLVERMIIVESERFNEQCNLIYEEEKKNCYASNQGNKNIKIPRKLAISFKCIEIKKQKKITVGSDIFYKPYISTFITIRRGDNKKEICVSELRDFDLIKESEYLMDNDLVTTRQAYEKLIHNMVQKKNLINKFIDVLFLGVEQCSHLNQFTLHKEGFSLEGCTQENVDLYFSLDDLTTIYEYYAKEQKILSSCFVDILGDELQRYKQSYEASATLELKNMRQKPENIGIFIEQIPIYLHISKSKMDMSTFNGGTDFQYVNQSIVLKIFSQRKSSTRESQKKQYTEHITKDRNRAEEYVKYLEEFVLYNKYNQVPSCHIKNVKKLISDVNLLNEIAFNFRVIKKKMQPLLDYINSY